MICGVGKFLGMWMEIIVIILIRKKLNFNLLILSLKKLKDKLDLLIKKLDKADNEKKHKKNSIGIRLCKEN